MKKEGHLIDEPKNKVIDDDTFKKRNRELNNTRVDWKATNEESRKKQIGCKNNAVDISGNKL